MSLAYDAKSGIQAGSSTSLTVSHTCTGSNLVLWAGLFLGSGDNVTGITYSGVSMTQAIKLNTNGTSWIYLYYLAAPASGANNLIASFTTDANPSLHGVSFTGASQTGIPDATASNTGATSPITTTLTTIADNCMAIMMARNTSGSYTASTNSTEALAGGVTYTDIFYSTALKTPAGSNNMQATYTGGGVWGGVIASFAPVGASSGNINTGFFHFM